MEETGKTAVAKRRKVAPKPAEPIRSAVPGVAKVEVKMGKAEKKNSKVKKADDKVADKVVRASFTMRYSDYTKIIELKQACLNAGMRVKKSELVRAGLQVLAAFDTTQLKAALAQMTQIKIGRPKKS
ncbi:MAG: hypothetical protein V4443_02310 [Pseudomonadota bacterium]